MRSGCWCQWKGGGNPLRVSRFISHILVSTSTEGAYQKKKRKITEATKPSTVYRSTMFKKKTACWFYQKMWRDSHTTPVFEGENHNKHILSGYPPGGSIRNLVFHPFIDWRSRKTSPNLTVEGQLDPKRAICSQNCQVLRICLSPCWSLKI